MIAVLALAGLCVGTYRSSMLAFRLYAETSSLEEMRELLLALTNRSSNIRVVRSEPDQRYPKAVLRAATQDLIRNRVRRQMSPDTKTSELSPWSEDLKALIEMLDELRYNPGFSDISPSYIDSAVAAAKRKLLEVDQYLNHYKHALFASVVHPADDLEIVEIDKVLEMIRKVNEAGYRVPLFRGAAHAVTGLYMGNIQNMVIINNHKNLKVELQSKAVGSKPFSAGDEERYKRLEVQIANAKARLSTALGEVGLPYSEDMGTLDELSFLTEKAIEVISEAKKLAENSINLSNTIGKQNTATYVKLQKAFANLQPLSVQETTETYLEDSGEESEEDTQSEQSSLVGSNGCLKGIPLHYTGGRLTGIGNETATKRLGLLVTTDTYVYDFRGNCTTLRAHHATLSRNTRGVKDMEEGGVTHLMRLTNQVLMTASRWIAARKRTRVIRQAKRLQGCRHARRSLKICRQKGNKGVSQDIPCRDRQG